MQTKEKYHPNQRDSLLVWPASFIIEHKLKITDGDASDITVRELDQFTSL